MSLFEGNVPLRSRAQTGQESAGRHVVPAITAASGLAAGPPYRWRTATKFSGETVTAKVSAATTGSRIKRRIRSMLGFKAKATAAIILSGIGMIDMMCKRQARYVYNPSPSIAEQFAILAA